MPEEQTERSQPVEQGAEKKALSTADANAARNASGSEVKEVQSTNPNKFESMTELPTIKDGMSLDEVRQSFGINMGDETAVTAAGIEAPAAKKKVSVDPRPSYVEGLKAVGTDEEAQGRFSIEYMERKAKEALDALLTPPAEQVLIASNVTPATPNLDSEVFEVKTDATNATGDGELLARKPNDSLYLEHPEAAPIQLPKINAKEIVNTTIQGTFTALDSSLKAVKLSDSATYKNVDYGACKAAVEKFPDLKAYGVNEKVIAAIILNELVHRDARDDAEDKQIREHGKVLNNDGSENITASIGPAQIQVRNVYRLADKYPQMKLFQSDPVGAALEPSIAPYFVAAYLQEQVDAFIQHDKIHPTELTPKCFESLLYTYNPDVVSKSNVLRNSLKPDDYREITASEKLEAAVTGHRSDSLKNWTSESYPRNQVILQKSGVVKTIKQTMDAVVTHFADK